MDGETLKILRKSHVFDEIDDKDLKTLLTCLNGSVRSFSAGNYLIMEADDVRYVGLVLEGRVTIQKEDFLGNLAHLTDIRVGELLGETFSLGATTQSAVTYVAATNCRIMFMPLWKILHVCSNQCACFLKDHFRIFRFFYIKVSFKAHIGSLTFTDFYTSICNSS